MKLHDLALLLSAAGAAVAGNVAFTFMTFHALLFCVMFAAYATVGFDKHFVLPAGAAPNSGTIAYFAATVSACYAVPGDIVPRTSLGRGLVGVHLSLSWMQSVVLLFMSTALRVVERDL